MSPFDDLSPRPVWAHFATLCSIPRASLHEAALRDYLVAWAGAYGIGATVDGVGNLILSKPASPGCEHAPGVVLQGHLDMVCQANAGTTHDFLHDPITVTLADGWIQAENTTLGADNGIGVALALAALEEPGLIHPPLEVLLTVNEEAGMDGARGLASGTLRGQMLINLDTEEWGHFYLGCAGGVDVEVRCDCALEAIPDGYRVWRLALTGLKGGHSGIDIHVGRGNAVKLLAQALGELSALCDVRLIGLEGGTVRNAIPREAFALVAVPASFALEAWVARGREELRRRFADADPDVRLGCEPSGDPRAQALLRSEGGRLLDFLCGVNNGVAAMSADFSGVVETSDNLGVIGLAAGAFRATFKVRSLSDGRAAGLAGDLVRQAAGFGLQAWTTGTYPGWTPNPDSPLLALCSRVYADCFGAPASLQVIHAGLECGLLAASHPQLDMISFGPDIRGAHAPGERVEVASVERCWQLLKAVLRALGEGQAPVG